MADSFPLILACVDNILTDQEIQDLWHTFLESHSSEQPFETADLSIYRHVPSGCVSRRGLSTCDVHVGGHDDQYRDTNDSQSDDQSSTIHEHSENIILSFPTQKGKPGGCEYIHI